MNFMIEKEGNFYITSQLAFSSYFNKKSGLALMYTNATITLKVKGHSGSETKKNKYPLLLF